jgi:hypothetical protein
MLQIYNFFLNNKRIRAKMCFSQGLRKGEERTKGVEGGEKSKNSLDDSEIVSNFAHSKLRL